MKRLIPLWFTAFVFTLLSADLAYAQKPTITSFSPTSGITATAASPTGGTDDVGTSNSEQTISAIAATMIKNIGSGYTGIATANGAEVRYSSTITTMASLKVTTSTPLTITYTLSSE